MTVPPDPREPANRRPIATRNTRIAQRIATRLAARRVSPNQISVLGLLFAVAAGACFWGTASETGALQRSLWLGGALLIQARLLCNLFDGMVAIERGITSPTGELFNEIPDRVADTAILVGLGASASGSLAWGLGASTAAVFVAYVRAAVQVAGGPADFRGPQSKSQRMALVTVLAVYLAVRPSTWALEFGEAEFGLIVVTVGSLWTAALRIHRGARALEGPPR